MSATRIHLFPTFIFQAPGAWTKPARWLVSIRPRSKKSNGALHGPGFLSLGFLYPASASFAEEL
jgi:hypothetical protein